MIRAATTDDFCGPAEGEKAFVQGLCDRLAAEFPAGEASLESAERHRAGKTVTYTIVACERMPGLLALNAAGVARHLREAAHAARKQELDSGPLFGREAAR